MYAIAFEMWLFLFFVLPVQSLYSPLSPLTITLTDKNFRKSVRTSERFWVVNYYASHNNDCEKFAPQYNMVAFALRGIVKFGVVDIVQNLGLRKKENVGVEPTIKLHVPGYNESIPYYREMNAKALLDFVVGTIKKVSETKLENKVEFTPTPVRELTEENFSEMTSKNKDKWLIVFYSPFCSTCKFIAQEWLKVVKGLQREVKFGALDANSYYDLAAHLGATKVPEVHLCFSGCRHKLIFTGYLSHRNVIDWVRENVYKEIKNDIIQITNNDALYDTCNSKGLCVITVFPPLDVCNAKCRLITLNTLHKLSKMHTNCGFVWTEKDAQPNIEMAFEITKYPAFIALLLDQMRFAILDQSLTYAHIEQFLINVASRNSHLQRVKFNEFPRMKATSAWNGKDVNIKNEL